MGHLNNLGLHYAGRMLSNSAVWQKPVFAGGTTLGEGTAETITESEPLGVQSDWDLREA